MHSIFLKQQQTNKYYYAVVGTFASGTFGSFGSDFVKNDCCSSWTCGGGFVSLKYVYKKMPNNDINMPAIVL